MTRGTVAKAARRNARSQALMDVPAGVTIMAAPAEGFSAAEITLMGHIAVAIRKVTAADCAPVGNCVPISMIGAYVMRHYGLNAEAVPCQIRLSGLNEADHDLGCSPQGNFAGHAVIRVKGAACEALLDLTFGQFRDPELGIRPEPYFTAWSLTKGAWDREPVAFASPELRATGISAVYYTLKPHNRWEDVTVNRGTIPGIEVAFVATSLKAQAELWGDKVIARMDRRVR